MKVGTATSVFFLAPIILALSTLVLADDSLLLRKQLNQSEWPEAINTLVATLYDSEHADLPFASQAYIEGEWHVAETGDSTTVTVTFDELAVPGSHEEIWMVLEADGKLVGRRSPVAAATSGVTFALGNVLDMDGNPITNVDDPVDSQDVATKIYVDNADTTGNASTATALASNGGNCNPGEYPLGIDASGTVEGCTPDATDDAVDTAELDNLCATNDKVLKRISGIWVCADDAEMVDTNAGTICPDGTFLNGDGSCDPATFGDITGVFAGSGLVGGGSNGDVSLDIGFPLSVTGSIAGPGASISATNAGIGGNAIRGMAAGGLFDMLTGAGAALYGDGPIGVFGVGGDGISGAGVFGISTGGDSPGVYGRSPEGPGVEGFSETGVGGRFSSASGHGLIVDNGNVGIGTGNPVQKLDIRDEINGSFEIRLNNTSTGQAAYSAIKFYNEYGIAGAQLVYCNFNNSLCNAGPKSLNLSANWGLLRLYGHDSVMFNTLYGEKMRITQAGDVGIGTDIPDYALHVKDSEITNDAPAIYGEHAVSDYFGIGVKGRGLYKGVEGVVSATGSNSYYGVVGSASTTNSSGNVYGVLGSASGGGAAYAGYFVGDVNVAGSLSKSGGSFKIDHPLDPENKYLAHSFVESPDMMNVYNGNVFLDEFGEAWVELPDWFEELNRDFRYQLTAIGAPGPNLYIAEKVLDNRFRIAGGLANMEISWQVTGIRQDAWAEANRISVEEDKAREQKGRYIHPELFGQPKEKGIDGMIKQGNR